MTFSKKSLLAVLLVSVCAINSMNAVSFAGFNTAELSPWIDRAKSECDSRATRFVGVSSKILFKANKEGIKAICVELKESYKVDKKAGNASWYSKKQLYKAFKKGVYKSWKKTQLFPNVDTVALNV